MVNSTRPMDRLICGDVGFGKTEVAMRAVYRAVLSGKQVSKSSFLSSFFHFLKSIDKFIFLFQKKKIIFQVALLAPTRVLAKQHERTLKLRMPDVE